MKTKQLITVLALVASNMTAGPNYSHGRWAISTIYNDNKEVVKWDYIHDSDEYVVIEIKVGEQWLTPISGYDGPTGAQAYTTKLGMMLTRAKFVTEDELHALDNVRANWMWQIENAGGKIHDYALTACGDLRLLQ